LRKKKKAGNYCRPFDLMMPLQELGFLIRATAEFQKVGELFVSVPTFAPDIAMKSRPGR